jgi:hypothetical protein
MCGQTRLVHALLGTIERKPCHFENDCLLQNPYNFKTDNLPDVMQCKSPNCSYLPNHPQCIFIGHKKSNHSGEKKQQSISLLQICVGLKSVLNLQDIKWSIQ